MKQDGRDIVTSFVMDPRFVGDEFSARAIGFAQQYKTPLVPEVFHTWYAYATRENAAINGEIDTLMNTGADISVDTLKGLFFANLSPRAISDEMDAIGSALTNTLGNVSAAMDENIREHSVFYGSLRSARATLASGSSKREVNDVIKNLHKANQQHLQAVQKMSVQLDKNRGQVSKLKTELIDARRASNTDYLTGLPNRRALDEQLDSAIFVARQKKRALTVLMAKINGLEQVSLDYGISSSDSIMRVFAELVRRGLSGDQYVARFAGAKFALLLPDTTSSSAFTIAEHFRKRFKQLESAGDDLGKALSQLSVAFGGTELTAGDDRTILIDRADRQLVRALESGDDRSMIS